MRRMFLVLLLTAGPAFALAEAPPDQSVPPPAEPPPAEAPPPPPQAGAQPPPQQAMPPPASAQPAPAPAPTPQPIAGPAGQWVYTAQYGWLWIPYAREYTYVPGDVQVFPDQYVYYPAYGWRWVVAPWVYGYGPSPYWGVYGPRPFVWYSRPWFRVGGYWGWGGYRGWGAYRGWMGPRVWGPRGWARAPAYYRTGVGGPHPNHAFRPDAHREVRGHGRGERRGHER